MPASTLREQAGARTRAPATSTTHTRQTLTGRQVLGVAQGRGVDALRAQASRMVEPAGTLTACAVDGEADRRRRLDRRGGRRPRRPGRRGQDDLGQRLGSRRLAEVRGVLVRRRIAAGRQALVLVVEGQFELLVPGHVLAVPRLPVVPELVVVALGIPVVGHRATNPGWRRADSMADDAVWPSPQIEASRMAWPISRRRTSSSSRERTREPAASRASSSSWRTLPTRHGTHCPHDSSRKNWAIRRRVSTRSTDLVEDHDHARAEGRPGGARRLEGQRQVERLRPDEDAGRAAEQDRPDRRGRRGRRRRGR